MNATPRSFPQRPGPLALPGAVALAAIAAMPWLAASNHSGWTVMCIVIAGLFAAFKALSWQPARVPAARQLAYLVGWVGMDMGAFIAPTLRPQRPPLYRWLSALACMTLGATLMWCIAPALLPVSPFTAGWSAMVGLVLMLHFGAFHALALAWQSAGINAQPIMHAPLLAPSVSAFWSKHWNLAFHIVTRRLLFHPACRRWGAPAATMLCFLASGLVHELAISVPARGGFGGPTLYFLIQGLAVLLEHSPWKPTPGWRARLFAAAIVLGPVGLLFHTTFIDRVALPLMTVLGAS